MKSICVMSDEHSYRMMSFLKQSPFPLKTPNLDRLAAKSIVFSHAYTNCPVCAPARSAFFTGKYVHRLGTWDNATPYDGRVPGLSHIFAENQKHFAVFGKTHFHCKGHYNFAAEGHAGYMRSADIGCFYRDQWVERIGAKDRYLNISIRPDEELKRDDKVLADALAHIAELKEKDAEDWHVYIGFSDPHFPFRVKQKNWDYYDERIKTLPAEMKAPFASLNPSLEQLRTYFASRDLEDGLQRKLLIGYCAAVTELDERIGRLLDFLAEEGLDQQTALIYTSDHGEQMGIHGVWWKCTMFEDSAHIPLMLCLPGTKAREITHPVSLVDLYPTLCALAGIRYDASETDGESLLGLVEEGGEAYKKDYAFSEYHCHGRKDGLYMIRWRDFKYIFYCDPESRNQLFNLKDDPEENHNLLSEDHREKNEELRQAESECKKRLYKVCDPYQVDLKAKTFQAKAKKALGLREYTEAKADTVVHPEF